MAIAYFSCSSGTSGDMIVGALISAGMPLDHLRAEIEKLGLPGISLHARPVSRSHLAGVKFSVTYPVESRARHLSDIEKIIENAALVAQVKERAVAIFHALAKAEAKVHDTDIDKVHFHEVGAADAIVDIVGACVGFEYFGVDQIYSSSINVGGGTVACDHGVMPVPAPATAELLRGIPTYSTAENGELATPTGSAILSTLAAGFGPQPGMLVSAIGYGAGERELAIPNLLRVSIGEPPGSSAEDGETTSILAETLGAQMDSVVVIETEIDDMNPELLPELVQGLMDLGALDVHHSLVTMKHGRPGLSLEAICTEERLEQVVRCLFDQSTTFGIRIQRANRIKLRREIAQVDTRYGRVGIKTGFLGTRVVTASPEHRDCVEAAHRCGVSLAEVYDEARAVYRQLHSGPSHFCGCDLGHS